MIIRNNYTFILFLIVHLFKGNLTANIQNSRKFLNPLCSIPKDELCGPGYAYTHSANMCQVVSEDACILTDTLPFKSKEECEAECFVDIELNTKVTEHNVPESLRIKTKVHLQQKKPLSKPKDIDESKEASKNDAPSTFSSPEKISDLIEDDYDWTDYKDHMVENVPRCEQPREVSLCRGFWPRWWFNKSEGECQEFTYGGCGRDDQTTNNFLTQYHCMTVCLEILPCPDDVSKACNVSTTECAKSSCLLHPDAICQVESCTCKATYIDDFGDLVNCIVPIEVPKLENPWYLWLIGVLALLLVVLCIICCYRCLQPRASYQNFQQDTSLVLASNEDSYTPHKIFEKRGKL